PWGRDGDHIMMTYTGGTTGMPKGVMWRQDDLFMALVPQMNPVYRGVDEPDLDLVRQSVTQPGPVGLPACPLMHGTGLYTQLIILSLGGSVVLLHSRSLDVRDILDNSRRGEVNQMAFRRHGVRRP